MKILSRYTRTEDQEIVREIYELYEKIFPKKPYVSVKGVQNILDDLAQSQLKAKDMRAAAMIDNQSVKELDESGFIDGLYR